MRCSDLVKNSVSNSVPVKRRPARNAAMAVLPDPEKGRKPGPPGSRTP